MPENRSVLEELAEIEKLVSLTKHSLEQAKFSYSVTVWMFTGLQLALCVYGLAVYLETPQTLRKGRLGYILMNFTILTVTTIVGITNRLELINEYTVFGIAGRTWGVGYASESILPVVLITLGDGMLLFRCYMIWSDRVWVSVIPTVLYFGAIAAGVAQLINSASLYAESQTFKAQPMSQAFLLITLSIIFPVLFNATTTSLIVWRIVKWRRKLSRALPGRKMSMFSGAANVLIEAALPLTLSGIVHALFFLAQRGTLFRMRQLMENGTTHVQFSELISILRYVRIMIPLTSVFEASYFMFVALAPQLVIFRVTTGRSFARKAQITANSFAASPRPEIGREMSDVGGRTD
ncbi:hypothetical protein FA15DRAFT_705533 [Coprinopsis marcescibilis]|uniref:Fungal pheromone STE3G-protein-coupled receptor n=1 Tax=Coprinopsis marcescibilis TaxID=230819 RepID=A0A5C3KSY7_COPMA|nr:hypothetical protein FA15DRAFT_705533 [Coprinopsis marcescibilis]